MNIKTHCSCNHIAPHHMIKFEIVKVIELSKRFRTQSKSIKSNHCRKSYCTLKFCLNQFQWNKDSRCSPSSPQAGCTPPHTSLHSSMRYRRIFDIIESMCRPTIELQMRPPFTYFEDWVQKLLSCKAGRSDSAEPFGGSRADLPILSIRPWHTKWSISFSPPHTSWHSSMRHRRFFDIIASMCRPTIGLQMRPPVTCFGDWVQKLCYCKSWEADLAAEGCWTISAAAGPPDLSYLLDPHLLENNFMKNYPRAPLLIIKIFVVLFLIICLILTTRLLFDFLNVNLLSYYRFIKLNI